MESSPPHDKLISIRLAQKGTRSSCVDQDLSSRPITPEKGYTSHPKGPSSSFPPKMPMSSPQRQYTDESWAATPSSSPPPLIVVTEAGSDSPDRLSNSSSLSFDSDDLGEIALDVPSEDEDENADSNEKKYTELDGSRFRYVRDRSGQGPFTKPHLITANPSPPFPGPHTALCVTSGPDRNKWIHIPRSLKDYEIIDLADKLYLTWNIRQSFTPNIEVVEHDFDPEQLAHTWYHLIPKSAWKLLGPPGATYPLTTSFEAPFAGPNVVISTCGVYFNGWFLHIPRLLTSEQISAAQNNLSEMTMNRWNWGPENEESSKIRLRQSTEETMQNIEIYQKQKKIADILEKDIGFDFAVQNAFDTEAEREEPLWVRCPNKYFLGPLYQKSYRTLSPLRRRPVPITMDTPDLSSSEEDPFSQPERDPADVVYDQAIGQGAKERLEEVLKRRLEETGTTERRPGKSHDYWLARYRNGHRYSGSTASSNVTEIIQGPDICHNAPPKALRIRKRSMGQTLHDSDDENQSGQTTLGDATSTALASSPGSDADVEDSTSDINDGPGLSTTQEAGLETASVHKLVGISEEEAQRQLQNIPETRTSSTVVVGSIPGQALSDGGSIDDEPDGGNAEEGFVRSNSPSSRGRPILVAITPMITDALSHPEAVDALIIPLDTSKYERADLSTIASGEIRTANNVEDQADISVIPFGSYQPLEVETVTDEYCTSSRCNFNHPQTAPERISVPVGLSDGNKLFPIPTYLHVEQVDAKQRSTANSRRNSVSSIDIAESISGYTLDLVESKEGSEAGGEAPTVRPSELFELETRNSQAPSLIMPLVDAPILRIVEDDLIDYSDSSSKSTLEGLDDVAFDRIMTHFFGDLKQWGEPSKKSSSSPYRGLNPSLFGIRVECDDGVYIFSPLPSDKMVNRTIRKSVKSMTVYFPEDWESAKAALRYRAVKNVLGPTSVLLVFSLLFSDMYHRHDGSLNAREDAEYTLTDSAMDSLASFERKLVIKAITEAPILRLLLRYGLLLGQAVNVLLCIDLSSRAVGVYWPWEYMLKPLLDCVTYAWRSIREIVLELAR